MGLKNIAALAIAVAAVGTMGVSPALARPHHDRHHGARKVCHTEWHHHHRVNVCRRR